MKAKVSVFMGHTVYALSKHKYM